MTRDNFKPLYVVIVYLLFIGVSNSANYSVDYQITGLQDGGENGNSASYSANFMSPLSLEAGTSAGYSATVGIEVLGMITNQNITNFFILFYTPTPNSSTTQFSNQFGVNASTTGDTLSNITVHLYNESGYELLATTSNTTPLYVQYSSVENGLYYFNATAYDTGNNLYVTETRNITINSTMNVYIIFPPDNYATDNVSITFAWQVNDTMPGNSSCTLSMNNNETGPFNSPNNAITYNNISLPDGVSTWFINCTDGSSIVTTQNRTITRVPYNFLSVSSSGGLASQVKVEYSVNNSPINMSACYVWNKDSSVNDPTYYWQQIYDGGNASNFTGEAVFFKDSQARLTLTCIDNNNNYFSRPFVANPTNSFNMTLLIVLLGAMILALVYAYTTRNMIIGVVASVLYLAYVKLMEYTNYSSVPEIAAMDFFVKLGLGMALAFLAFSFIKDRYMDSNKKEEDSGGFSNG